MVPNFGPSGSPAPLECYLDSESHRGIVPRHNESHRRAVGCVHVKTCGTRSGCCEQTGMYSCPGQCRCGAPVGSPGGSGIPASASMGGQGDREHTGRLSDSAGAVADRRKGCSGAVSDPARSVLGVTGGAPHTSGYAVGVLQSVVTPPLQRATIDLFGPRA